MRLTEEDFLKGLDLLSSVHGDDYPVFKHPEIAQIWLEFFQARCTPSKFFKLIRHHLQMSPFFPESQTISARFGRNQEMKDDLGKIG